MFTNNNYKIFFSALWLVWTTLHGIALYAWGFSIELSVADSLASNISLVIACLMITYPLKYYRPDKRSAWQLIIWIVVITAIWHTTIMYTLPMLPWANYDYLIGLDKSILLRLAIGFLIVCFTVMVRWLWEMGEEQRKTNEQQQQNEELSRKTELATLRQQLHPHFLFNTLNSVSALIGTKPTEARKMVLQLSDFLRGSINKQDKQQVKLEEDLAQIKLYLEIEKVRFGHRLDAAFDIAENTEKMNLPAFVLQPLVENAVKFGLYDTTENVCIDIATKMENGYLTLSISNPFDASTSAQLAGTGFGQSSVKRRLFLLFGRADLFTTTINETTYTTTIKIPQ